MIHRLHPDQLNIRSAWGKGSRGTQTSVSFKALLCDSDKNNQDWESLCVCVTCSVVSDCLQPMEISRQEYWSELPFPSPGDLPDPGIQPGSPTLQGDSLPSEPQGSPENHCSILQQWSRLPKEVFGAHDQNFINVLWVRNTVEVPGNYRLYEWSLVN